MRSEGRGARGGGREEGGGRDEKSFLHNIQYGEIVARLERNATVCRQTRN